MADNVAQESPGTEFVRPCNMCPHMKRITLHNIRTALESMAPEITVDPQVAGRARAAIDAMLAVG
jgi:quinolinate synthase